MLTIDEILASSDLMEEIIDCPEWGGQVKIRSFSKACQLDIRKAASVGGSLDNDKLEMLLLVQGMVEPQFAADQIPLLREKSAVVIDRILKRILEVAGMAEGSVKESERSFPARPGEDVPVQAG
jgi:hypothetical protein